jgi:hypothetical protein
MGSGGVNPDVHMQVAVICLIVALVAALVAVVLGIEKERQR